MMSNMPESAQELWLVNIVVIIDLAKGNGYSLYLRYSTDGSNPRDILQDSTLEANDDC